MDSSGLPIPIGGSKPLAAVLLELSSRGLRLSGFPAPPQARDALFTSSGIDPGDAPSSSHLNVTDFAGSEFWPNQGIDMGLISHELQNLDTTTGHSPVSSSAGFSDLVQKFEIRGSCGNKLFTEEQQLHGQQLQVPTTSREQPGRSLTTNAQLKHPTMNSDQQNFQQLLSSAESFMDQGTKNQNNPKQLSASTKKPVASKQIKTVENQGPQHSDQPGSSQCHQQDKHHEHRTFLLSPLSPTAALPHMNLLPMTESLKLSFTTQSLVDNERRRGKQRAEEQQVSGKVHPEESGVNTPYKPGRGAECLNQYMFLQRNRPRDNNIQFWRNLVATFFSPCAKRRWCVSSYKNIKQIQSLFKVAWRCNTCNATPCCGFEITGELLPRLHKMKYDVGILEERLHIDTPDEHQGACGEIILHCPRAVEESEYEQVRIARYGQLRVVLTPDMKICVWEFCTQRHEEYISRNLVSPQACQLGAAMQNYQFSTQDSSSITAREKQKHIDMFICSAYQMLEALGTPFISQTGISKQYERYLQISEVLNIMNDLIDYSQEYGLGPKESISKFPQFGSNISSGKNSNQQQLSRAPYLKAFAGAGAGAGAGSFSGFSADGSGNITASTSMGSNRHKKQCIGRKSTSTEIPTHSTSVWLSTPLFGIQPQFSHVTIGKLGTESAAENVCAKPKISVSPKPCPPNIVDFNDSLSTVESITQEVMAALLQNRTDGVTGFSDAENMNGAMPTGNNTISGTSVAANKVTCIDVENYQSKDTGIGFSASATGMTPSGQTDMDVDSDVFPKDTKSNYLPNEYDKQLNQFVDFADLHELLK